MLLGLNETGMCASHTQIDVRYGMNHNYTYDTLVLLVNRRQSSISIPS